MIPVFPHTDFSWVGQQGIFTANQVLVVQSIRVAVVAALDINQLHPSTEDLGLYLGLQLAKRVLLLQAGEPPKPQPPADEQLEKLPSSPRLRSGRTHVPSLRPRRVKI